MLRGVGAHPVHIPASSLALSSPEKTQHLDQQQKSSCAQFPKKTLPKGGGKWGRVVFSRGPTSLGFLRFEYLDSCCDCNLIIVPQG